MTIKKLIVGSIFSMLLASEMAVADWGDVYYCQTTNLYTISLEGEKISYNLERFQFKLDQARNAMVFGSTGYLKDAVAKLTKDANWPSQEAWYGAYKFANWYFEEGKLLFTLNNSEGIVTISADCDKF
jgi:hypothetical protein